MEWIKVEDKLPDINPVLIFSNDQIEIGYFFKDGWKTLDGGYWNDIDVKYWMPLPKAPKE